MLSTEVYSSQISYNILFESIEQSSDHIAIVNKNGEYVYINKSYVENSGYNRDFLLNKKISLLKSEKQDDKFYSQLWSNLLNNKKFDAVFINKRKNNTLYYEHQVITPIVVDNIVKYFLIIGRDIQDKYEKESKLLNMAMRDRLTGLFNRYAFDEFIKDLKTQEVILALCDIDYFKRVNDMHGHEVGDKVLKELANIFIDSLRKKDAVFRWGGEEFILIINANLKDSLKVLEKIRKKVESNIFLNGVKITCSFGVSIFNALDVNGSIKIADNNLYKSKKSGRNNIVF
jgi:diguanylate cyclase (GGDEF)-like protein/PAS domain S-box-containing protein